MSELKDVLISLALLVPSIGVGAVILWRFPVTTSYRCNRCDEIVVDGSSHSCE